jgi:hypothetical protein
LILDKNYRLSKTINANKKILGQNLIESLKEYEWIASYTKRNGANNLSKEIEISNQMLDLLPIKISALMEETT